VSVDTTINKNSLPEKNEMALVNQLNAMRAALIKTPELWQHDLLTVQKFWKFCSDRGVRAFNYEVIESLWALGFIRADLLMCDEKLAIQGLELLFEEQNCFFYLDKRVLEPRSDGYGGSFKDASLEKNIRPYFHPFRFYVLYHVLRVFDFNISTTQFLSNPEGQIRVSETQNEYFSQFTSTNKFCDLFDKWNITAEASIALEPYTYGKIYGHLRIRFPDTEETLAKKMEDYADKLSKIIEQSDQKIFEEKRQELCQNAEQIDSNKSLHVLLRLTSWHKKNKLDGDIGGALLLLSMAETIRRAFEKSLGIELPEEDELGFGQWMPGARKALYGSERALDAPKEAIRDFLVDAGLDFGTKVRCYVEGPTEYGALSYAFGEMEGVQIINLRGQFIEKKGKGVAFRESLKHDLKAKVFSYVILDKDRDDYVRSVKKAAEEDILSGGFFLSSPDVEFENFSLDQLVDVVCELCGESNVDMPDKSAILKEVAGVKNGKSFFKALDGAGVDTSVTKGEDWGRALMKYAIDNDIDCSLFDAAQKVAHAASIKFQYSRDKFRVDVNTGKPIAR